MNESRPQSEEIETIPWDDRVEEIRALLETWKPTAQENNEAFNCREDCVYLLRSFDITLGLLRFAAPYLFTAASHCEECEGSGEKIVGNAPDDYWSEPCKECKPIWDLVKLIQPLRPAPMIVSAPTAEEEDDDNPF